MRYRLRQILVEFTKNLLGTDNLSLWIRKKKQSITKLFIRKKYTAKDILNIMIQQGLKPGDTIIVHCAMNNFYNYQGSVKEILDTLIEYLGSEGTLCMPAYPYNKTDSQIPFDVINDKTAGGLLAETFRKYPGVKRSLNKLHSVSALGKNAEYLVNEHHLSNTCFDEKSPFYKLGTVHGKSFSLGLPSYYIGTIAHVCESLLYKQLPFFRQKFKYYVEFSYIKNGIRTSHKMWTGSDKPYIRKNNTNYIDKNFDKDKYSRIRLSNIWINMYDAEYCIKRMVELSKEGKTIYKYPKYFNED